jgi:hypothetical protein
MSNVAVCRETGKPHKWRLNREKKGVNFKNGFMYWPYKCLDCPRTRTVKLRVGESPPYTI